MVTDDGIKSSTGRTSVRLGSDTLHRADVQQPLRMELFSLEQRHERGQALGQEHHAGRQERGGDLLLRRLRDNEAALRRVHRELVDDITEKKPVTPVGEWLVDNFYVIEEQIGMAYRHLPRTYLMELPRLSNPGKVGIPRVYDLAEHIIAYGDSRVEATDLSVIVTAYQEATPLNLGELWAVPIMLRLALIENIRRMAVLVEHCREGRDEARRWADELIRVDEEDPKNLVLSVAAMAKAGPRLGGAFVAEFKRTLQGRGSGMKLPLQWVEQNLNERGRSVDQVINEENHDQAVLEMSMRNCIVSLRGLNVTDWSEFVETMSRVEQTLRKDPADVYARMDFATRDDYRRVVERLARKGDCDEVGVAAGCLDLARSAAVTRGADNPAAHVGYYLIGPGKMELRRAIGYQGGVGSWLRSASARYVLALYLGAIVLLTALFTGVTAFVAHAGGVHGDWLAVVTVLLAVTTGHLAVGLVNLVVTQLAGPRLLPRLNYAKGIPSEDRTLVVVPLLLASEKGVGDMLRNLEGHYLNNRGRNIHFGLLTDYADAPAETMPDDERLLNLCRQGIVRLNDRYQDDGGDNFFLFHRPRKWNETERVWMGWERKRGKLEDLNRYLRGADPDVFSRVEGRTQALSNVRYVITLDADTQMARDSAWQMVGAMAHPLNRPTYDGGLGRVVVGHGILQPRVEATLTGANRSRYARMCASELGIDPYTRASSDVYQDLFDEGSFIGKGIYEVETFDRALGGRFPDNKILSHDLLEGCVVRSGLLSDVKLYEDPPNSYLMDIQRRHRWVRGDWQIASYLLARETRDGRAVGTKPLNVLSQWKVFDNLRRSLTPIALFLLLLLGLAVFTNPGLYVLVVGCAFLGTVAAAGVVGLCRKSPEKTVVQHVRNSLGATGRQAVQTAFKFACLPYEAYVAADAIVRSLWRQCVSRRKLLQWNPSDNSFNPRHVAVAPIARIMWVCPLAAIGMAVVIARKNPTLLAYAAPLLLLWLLAPLFVAWLSRPRRARREVLSDRQRAFLRGAARRIWLFFEDFVTEGENWLPPDNYQERPVERIAHRTSPTNMGLSLLANLSAYDFGYIGAGRLLDRTGNALKTMLAMERHRGHFYNWYDTRTLEVLRPAYVSTVDSGNLAAHALVLAAGLRGLAAGPVVNPSVFVGLRDTLNLAAEDVDSSVAAVLGDLEPLRREVAAAAVASPKKPLDYFHRLYAIADLARRLDAKWYDGSQAGEGAARWLAAFLEQCGDAVAELEALMPWAVHLADHPEWLDFEQMRAIPSLLAVADMGERMRAAGAKDGRTPPPELAELIAKAESNACDRLGRIRSALADCGNIADIEYDFLYDKSKRLLAIGYNADENRLDNSFYDLLASEARLSTYLGIVQHKIPQNAWFALGRMLTLSGGRPLLISWSGSMFEYLMPLLVMPSYDDSLLDETYKACVEAQMEYAAGRGVPWGISESGYYLFDSDQNYQYRAFGVPELGLKHSLSEDLVVAPYASMLATMVFPARAAANLMRMDETGFQTLRGFYEAVDYTPTRLARNERRAVVRSHMAHHQGMSLVALGQALLDRPMHRRFAANPLLDSATMLLQEMVPSEKALYFHSTYSPEIVQREGVEETPMRVLTNPNSPHPEVQLLSNGNYHVMLTSAGGGYSRWRDVALTRWREDVTRDSWGFFCYLRDRETGETWSATHQPVGKRAGSYQAVFVEGKAEFHRRDDDFDCRTEIVVAPEDDVEIRRLRIANRGARRRVVDVTSYAEVVLAPAAADDSHQAFSKLFVQTRLVRDRQAVVCSRRPRDVWEKSPLLFHLLAVRGSGGGEVSYETDRLAFLGRCNDASCPAAVMSGDERLAGGEGAVLDPIMAIRSPVILEPGETAVIDFVVGVAEDEETMARLLEKYQDERVADKTFDLAWTHGQLLLRQLNISDGEAQRFCQLAGSVIYANPAMRADAQTIVRNRKGQPGLWGYAISGDLPLVLLTVSDPSRLPLINEMIQAHTYWRHKGLKVDLMIWNEDQTGYRLTLHDQIVGLAGAALEDATTEKPGGIFIRTPERISEEDRVLIQTVARVVMADVDGMLEQQLRRLAKAGIVSTAAIVQPRHAPSRPNVVDPVPVGKLQFFNGYGGFSADGKEYVVVTSDEAKTSLPWVNVLANDSFGCVVSESGSSYTWSENAHEFRLTPWENDPVSDAGGEAIYLRDEQTGDFWSPTPLPCRAGGQYVTRHGFGYSVFEHNEYGINSVLTVHVDREASVKFYTLKLTNNTGQRRNLSATGYVEWVLGDLPSHTAMHVVSGVDSRSGALFARNQYNEEFRGRTAFLDVDDPGRSVCGDRRDFLGRNGSPARPFAMRRTNLSGRVGPGLDPCGAAQVKFNLGPGQSREIVFRIGVAADVDAARKLVRQFRGVAAARDSLRATKEFWRGVLGTIQVETPDKAFDLMVNGWLLYQALACRFWGRSALYQSGGAFGFRDQLQDSMALVYADPALVRKHILGSAARQFPQGDVQHWWHPPAGRGVRTMCSDDYLWLPYVVERYVRVTGDTDILDENVRFIEGRPLREDEESYYDLPQRSEERASLYEHCKRSIMHGLRMGEHGLPLMGSGDWNDGMDRVGRGGKGESVWLGFFLHVVLEHFEGFAEGRGDGTFAAHCREEAATLAANIEQHAWDGDWYRRAYFDDGRPLGSAHCPECRIDSIAQSWAVLSGVGAPERVEKAMRALDEHLIDHRHMIVKLFDPPFDASDMNPGYIKGYVPGVRENGGQYTHAAIWTGMAFAGLRDAASAWEAQRILNPVNHGLSRELAEVYKVEPYVVSADVYANPRHLGRGGWSWYTGSASWLYRFMLESILGFNLEADAIRLTPCVPREWDGYVIRFSGKGARYEITVTRQRAGGGEATITIDGVANKEQPIRIADDQKDHKVEVVLSRRLQSKYLINAARNGAA